MAVRHIVNQDRDRIYPFDPSVLIYVTTVMHEEAYIGTNLMMGSAFLGTFEIPSQAVQEVSNIYNRTDEIYAVSGFSDWRLSDETEPKEELWDIH